MIAGSAGRQLARLAGVEATTWEPAESTVQLTVEKLADRVFIASYRRAKFNVYFEFYTNWHRKARWDMLAKSGLLSQRDELATVTIAIVLRKKGFKSQGGQLRLEVAGKPTQQLWYHEVCLWTVEPEAWWENEPGLMALYPLCNHGKLPGDAVTHAAATIEANAENSPEQGTFLALLGIFGKLNYPNLDVAQLIGVEKMKDSKFYQEIIEHGKIEGRIEGELESKREDILEALDARFGAIAVAELSPTVAGLEEIERAKHIFRLVLRSSTIDEVRSTLGSLGQPTS